MQIYKNYLENINKIEDISIKKDLFKTLSTDFCNYVNLSFEIYLSAINTESLNPLSDLIYKMFVNISISPNDFSEFLFDEEFSLLATFKDIYGEDCKEYADFYKLLEIIDLAYFEYIVNHFELGNKSFGGCANLKDAQNNARIFLQEFIFAQNVLKSLDIK